MSLKLTIGYFYRQLLNLYGDNGNVEILVQRAKRRGIDVQVLEIEPHTKLTSEIMSTIDLVFMGGGPDSGQKDMYADLKNVKGPYLADYIANDGVGLFICGSYQLLGHYYKASDGTILDGLGVFDLYTQNFGVTKPRCIGNTIAKLSSSITSDLIFQAVNALDEYIVGFENHGGRTYLAKSQNPMAKVVSGHGNNGEDGYEGIHYKNTFGTYFHGPFLSKNAHIADYLIAKALNVTSLEKLPDDIVKLAHSASKKLRH